MINLIKRFLQKIFLKILPPDIILEHITNYELIEQKLNELKIKRCNKQAVMGENSRFHEESEVNNFQYDKQKITIGTSTHIRCELLTFANGGEIKIGNNCYIGKNTVIWSASSIYIGNDVLISHNCNIIDTNSHEIDHIERAEGYKKLLLLGHSKEKNNVISAPIIIEDNAWISFNVSILKGVTIGKGAIVAANSLVTKDVPPFTLFAGNPAKLVKYLNIKENDSENS